MMKFNSPAALPYHTYNSLFLSLPFDEIAETGTLLALFSQHCEEGYKAGKSPQELVESVLFGPNGIAAGARKGHLVIDCSTISPSATRDFASRLAKLGAGMVIAIEPMVNFGVKEVWYDDDGWTVRTKDGKVSAHYEHTVCVRKNKADLLSSFEEIEKAEKSNPDLQSAYY